MLSSRITEFDNAIAGDVLELFPGGIESLPGLTDEEIQAVVNDFAVPGSGSNGAGTGAGANYKKARLCLYGTTALVALVDPAHENLWVANLGDCEAGTCPARKQKNKNRVEVFFFSHQCWLRRTRTGASHVTRCSTCCTTAVTRPKSHVCGVIILANRRA